MFTSAQCVNVDDEEGPTHGKLSVPAAHVFLNLALASETGVQVMVSGLRLLGLPALPSPQPPTP